ncbi:MAG: 2-dehydropantoate 2-reductase [Chloroflexota bacterium]|nr:2-dehydropantoate 2-reductase [Chloroflexota bacterium]
MRISIVGSGAMGSLMAGRLARASASSSESSARTEGIDHVLLYGRPSPHLEAIQRDGLRLIEMDGSTRTIPIQASSDPADVRGSDVVLVLVKAWATAEAAAPLRSYLTRDTIVLTLQNGLGNAASLRSALLHEGVRPHVWLGVTTQAAIRSEPGTIIHTGAGITAIGRRSEEVDTRIRDIASTLSLSGLQTVAVADIHRWVWRKLAVNAAINPLTALAGVPNATISSDPELRSAAATLAAEVVAVANAINVPLDLNEVLGAVDEVARATGRNRSSMLVDLEAGIRTEIDAINGAIVAESRRLRTRAPANHLMTALIRAQERRVHSPAVTPGGDDGLDPDHVDASVFA